MSYFLVERNQEIHKITINRPDQSNAFNSEMWHQFTEIIDSLSDDIETRAIIITGMGKNFAAGNDISEISKWTDKEKHRKYQGFMDKAFKSIKRYPQPVIAMINGWCMGAGCELALYCDLRICSEEARFGIPAAKLGIVLNYEMIQELVNVVGVSAAKEILLVADSISASRAYDIGLVNQVVAASELEEKTADLAKKIALNAPLAIRGMKKGVDSYFKFQAQINHSDEAEVESFESEDHSEAIKAFLEKRKPVWRGK